MDLPARLIDEIVSGNCIAFIGAGFTAPAVPQWRSLLAELADAELGDPAIARGVHAMIEGGSSRDLGAAAQTLRDSLGEERFFAIVRERLADPPLDDTMRRRLAQLGGIPFRAILTTNFDGVLPGEPPDRQAYLDVLRPSGHRWWDERFWDQNQAGARVVKLHGSVSQPESVVFTHRDYRRLYASPAYATFLRSVMASTTVLYMGFSFSDAYLNELRSEILALLDHQGGDVPVAYAIMNDPTEAEIEYSRRHEGIEILPVETKGGDDYSQFDRYLENLYEATNPKQRLARLVSRRKIVWVGPRHRALERLEQAAAQSEIGTTLISVPTFDEADTANVDLLIWNGPPRDLPATPPIRIVFRPGESRQPALEAGASGAASSFGELVQELVRILAG